MLDELSGAFEDLSTIVLTHLSRFGIDFGLVSVILKVSVGNKLTNVVVSGYSAHSPGVEDLVNGLDLSFSELEIASFVKHTNSKSISWVEASLIWDNGIKGFRLIGVVVFLSIGSFFGSDLGNLIMETQNCQNEDQQISSVDAPESVSIEHMPHIIEQELVLGEDRVIDGVILLQEAQSSQEFVGLRIVKLRNLANFKIVNDSQIEFLDESGGEGSLTGSIHLGGIVDEGVVFDSFLN
mmetsp:Transcript_4687/g.3855  ORF Transcript_4687/g.3855 Transcript_4687/m.3855 type:complete len:238 (-) Transcript_4687:226-939(-)